MPPSAARSVPTMRIVRQRFAEVPGDCEGAPAGSERAPAAVEIHFGTCALRGSASEPADDERRLARGVALEAVGGLDVDPHLRRQLERCMHAQKPQALLCES